AVRLARDRNAEHDPIPRPGSDERTERVVVRQRQDVAGFRDGFDETALGDSFHRYRDALARRLGEKPLKRIVVVARDVERFTDEVERLRPHTENQLIRAVVRGKPNLSPKKSATCIRHCRCSLSETKKGRTVASAALAKREDVLDQVI